jgi:hypothetical protein
MIMCSGLLAEHILEHNLTQYDDDDDDDDDNDKIIEGVFINVLAQ